MERRRHHLTALAVVLSTSTAALAAQNTDPAASYPQRPVRFVIGQ